MKLTRRSFLAGSAAAALASPRLAAARGLLVAPQLDTVIGRALAAATKAGASYADVRIVRRRSETVATREDRVDRVTAAEDYGVGVRVIAGGAWGFAASPVVTVADAERIARAAVDIAKANAPHVKHPVTLAPVSPRIDVWQTALVKDPFKIPLEDKAELLLAFNQEALKVRGVKFATASFTGHAEWKLFASTDGTFLEQEIFRLGPELQLTAVDDKRGEFETRSHGLPPRQAGWEYIEAAQLVGDARALAEQVVEKLKAPSVAPGKHDLVILPTNLWLTIHESIGHPTELDRALGYEANFAGTSFATPDKRGTLRVGAPHLTFYADKTTPGGLATCGYDDDGVATQRWNLVENGVFVGYQTTREQAGWIGEKASRGTSYADSYASFPFQRMPNVSLAPATRERSLDDLIAGVDDGILIDGNGSWSIDHQRLNFQFGGQAFWEIKRGRKTRMLRDVAYQANTIAFWTSCDAIGGPSTWWLGGTLNDGKGEPSQNNAVSHGCPPARFRKVDVLNTNRRGAPGGLAMIGEGKARQIVERVLALAKGNKVDATVELTQERIGNTRFARDEITSSADVDRTALVLTAQLGHRRASARTNQLDDHALDDLVGRAVRLARLAPENPEAQPPLGKQSYLAVDHAVDAATAAMTPAARAQAVAAALGANQKLVELAGFYEHTGATRALATTAGLWAFHARSTCRLSCTARTADGTGSGWAGRASNKAADLDAAALAREAVVTALASKKPRRLDPGRYTVVLAPAATAGLLQFLTGAFDARRADEGRSFFAKTGGTTRVGDKLFPETITLRADPTDAALAALPFDGDGLPRKPTAWIDRGVVTQLAYDRYWASQRHKPPTARPDGWSLAGDKTSREDLVKGVARGVLVTRVWYLPELDPQTLLVTGLTRDGTFLIERGEVVGPVNNFRFNESPVQMLARCDGLGAQAIPGGTEGAGIRAPIVRTHEFNLASISEAI